MSDDVPHDQQPDEPGLNLALAVARAAKRVRLTRGYTLEELADRSGLHRTHIGLVERGERHLSIDSAARIASALGLRLADLVEEAERGLGDRVSEGAAVIVGEPIELVRRPPKRRARPECLEDEEALRHLTGMPGEWLLRAIEETYQTLDLIDAKMVESGSDPLARLVELANLSAMIGNLIGGSLAHGSAGRFKRNRPHTFPDLVAVDDEVDGIEIKMALEKNKPKGHLPKPGLHMTLRYVLGDSDGSYTRGQRGSTAWIWEVRVGHLTEADYDNSNTAGDSGKTSNIKTVTFQNMSRVYYAGAFLPYADQNGPYGARHP